MTKKIYLFNVYDLVGDTYLNDKPVMVQNELNAALAFYNSFVKEKDPVKNPYGYKSVRLVIFGYLVVDENDEPQQYVKNLNEYDAKEAVTLINQIMAERGVDDFIIDETEGNQETK